MRKDRLDHRPPDCREGVVLSYTNPFLLHELTPSPLRTLLKHNPNGDFVLITVNMDNTVITGQFKFHRSPGQPKLMFGGKNEIILGKGGRSFTLSYEPSEIKVVQFKSQEQNTDYK